MRTLVKPQYLAILRALYNAKNTPQHLRELARQTKIRESAISRHLEQLEKLHILLHIKEGPLKKFYIRRRYIPQTYPIFDKERIEKLPVIRRTTLEQYIKNLKEKPIFLILFGSTAKSSFSDASDIDILEIYNRKTDTREAKRDADIDIQTFQLTFNEFIKELKNRREPVVQAAIETGIPFFNEQYYYEVLLDAREGILETPPRPSFP